jgi:ATP-dependent helicase HepA
VQIAAALDNAERDLGAELTRLTALRRINPAVSAKELETIQAELDALRAALPRSLLRLDAVRFVCSTDFLSLR